MISGPLKVRSTYLDVQANNIDPVPPIEPQIPKLNNNTRFSKLFIKRVPAVSLNRNTSAQTVSWLPSVARYQAVSKIWKLVDQRESCWFTARYRFRYNHNLKDDVQIIESSRAKITLPIRNQCLHWVCQIDCSVTERNISISKIAYLADNQLNLLGPYWPGQLGLLNLPISFISSYVHSATSATSFAVDMMVQCFNEAFQEGLGLCNHTKATLKLVPNAQSVSIQCGQS
ncbi:hypothetical protein ACTXT7_006423 [Hymenolepis weldensis]